MRHGSSFFRVEFFAWPCIYANIKVKVNKIAAFLRSNDFVMVKILAIGMLAGLIFQADSVLGQKMVADSVTVYKSKRIMKLWRAGKAINTFEIELGDSPKGHKTTEGDEKTPEGKYVLDYKNAQSSYYKSMHISYPNSSDLAQAKRRKVRAGGDIFVHGTPLQYSLFNDWTDGCIALTNSNMDVFWERVKDGTLIYIHP